MTPTRTKRRTKSIGKVIVKKFNKTKAKKNLDSLWSQAVRIRDGRCCKCGSVTCLNAHHIFGRRHLATRWVIDNGITLCMPCHIFWAHRDPGTFMAWWIGKYGKSEFDRLSNMSQMIYQEKSIPWDTIAMTLNNYLISKTMTDGGR